MSSQLRISELGRNPGQDATALLDLYSLENIDAELQREFPDYVERYSGKQDHAAIEQRIRNVYTEAGGLERPTLGFIAFLGSRPVGMATAAMNDMPGTDLSPYGLEEVMNLNWLVIARARRHRVGYALGSRIADAALKATQTEGNPYFGQQVLTTIGVANIASQQVARFAGLEPFGAVYNRIDEQTIDGQQTPVNVPAQLWVPRGTVLQIS